MSAPPTDVVDRLERLAAQAPARDVDPDALWTQGRRRQRVRTGMVGAALVVAALLGTATAPLLVQRAQRVEPAVSEDRLVLPDVIRQPGMWEPAFPAAPGRLSAVGVGPRGTIWPLSGRNAVWGVSSSTGESRFLDLPGVSELPSAPALSADGTLVAYWATGDVEGEPIVNGVVGDDDHQPVVGVAVLDLETGERDVWEIDSEHGLSTGGMAWAGEVLWWSAGPVRRESSTATSARIGTRTWDLATGARAGSLNERQRRVSGNGVGDAPGGFVEERGARKVQLVAGGGEPTSIRLSLPVGTPPAADVTQSAVSTDGSRLAALLMPDASRFDDARLPVVVGAVDGRRVTLAEVEAAEAQAVLGWRSPTEVVVASVDEVDEGRPMRVNQAWTLDVTTGERTALLQFSGNTPHVAANAWTAEVVPAPDAPFAPDPRLVGAGGMLALVFCVSLWRDLRRRRAHS
jgi:hypothetical protein